MSTREAILWDITRHTAKAGTWTGSLVENIHAVSSRVADWDWRGWHLAEAFDDLPGLTSFDDGLESVGRFVCGRKARLRSAVALTRGGSLLQKLTKR